MKGNPLKVALAIIVEAAAVGFCVAVGLLLRQLWQWQPTIGLLVTSFVVLFVAGHILVYKTFKDKSG